MAENEKSWSDRPRNGAILYLEGAISWDICGEILSFLYCRFYRVWRKPSENHKNTALKVDPSEFLTAERRESDRSPAGHNLG